MTCGWRSQGRKRKMGCCLPIGMEVEVTLGRFGGHQESRNYLPDLVCSCGRQRCCLFLWCVLRQFSIRPLGLSNRGHTRCCFCSSLRPALKGNGFCKKNKTFLTAGGRHLKNYSISVGHRMKGTCHKPCVPRLSGCASNFCSKFVHLGGG